MDRFKNLKDMVGAELDRIQMKGELNMNTLEKLDLLAHTMKSLETVDAMNASKERGYAEHYPYPMYYDNGMSMAGMNMTPMSYRDGRGRGPYADRDSMGRYSSDDEMGGNGTSYRRY